MKYHRSPKMAEAWAPWKWCCDTFGNEYEAHPLERRWYRRGGYLFFREEKDLAWFLLRWS